jgi:hypothetical protein
MVDVICEKHSFSKTRDLSVSLLCFDGTDPTSEYFANIYELIIKSFPKIKPLLILCGIDEKYIDGDAVPDFDKFMAMCKAFPMLTGNEDYIGAHVLLRELFDCELEINEENGARIWEFCNGDGLGYSGAELLVRGRVDEMFLPFEKMPSATASGVKAMPLLSLNLLAEHIFNTHSTDEIDALIQARCEQMKSAGAGIASVRLDTDFEFVKPSPYGIAMILKKISDGEKISENDKNALAVQLLRSASKLLDAKGFSLIISARPSVQLTKTLEYLRDSVGLCRILLCAENVYPNELENYLFSLPPDILGKITPCNAGVENGEDALRHYARRFAIARLPHLGLLTSKTAFASLAMQRHLQGALCNYVSEEEMIKICTDNFYSITRCQNEICS